MNTITSIPCDLPDCKGFAMNAAILGTQRFCVVPAMSDMKINRPLVRFNVCDLHLDSVRSNFQEVYHEALSDDFSDVAVFV